MRTGKSVRSQESGVRSQNKDILTPCLLPRTFYFLLLTFYFLLPTSNYVFAQDIIKESLSDLNRILPAKKVITGEWGRDPFVPIVGERFMSMKLTAIIYNDKKPAAIVNNKIIYVGDSVDGQKVVDITKQYVILRGMDGSYKLEIDTSPGQTYEIKENR